MSALREAGDTRAWTHEPERSRLSLTGQAEGAIPGIINLSNMHREYVDTAPDERQTCLRNQAAGLMSSSVPSSLAEAQPGLRPVIRSSTERGVIKLQAFGADSLVELAYRPLCENLEIGLAYDGEFNLLRLDSATLEQWGITFDEALDIAIDNLRLVSSQPWLPLQNGVFVSQFNDYYDASRLLLPDVLYRQPIAGAPVVMAPNRTALLLTGDRNEAGLKTLLAAAEGALDQARALPPLMLRWSGTAWEKFTPEALAGKLHQLRLRELAGDYHDQKTLIDEIHDQENVDIFVAQHTVLESEDGQQRSICVWSEGVHSLLPDTDYVALFRHETQQTACVPRSVLHEQLGDFLKPTDYLPIRHEVTAFPDAAKFEAMLSTYGALPGRSETS
ncbi:hypothetical protein [Pandoraea pnomenusa]|uniref:hypothetical protein n=1 Tax=Pandoraea pnomenusa TaxID=93220 RepID=UPI00333EE8FB